MSMEMPFQKEMPYRIYVKTETAIRRKIKTETAILKILLATVYQYSVYWDHPKKQWYVLKR